MDMESMLESTEPYFLENGTKVKPMAMGSILKTMAISESDFLSMIKEWVEAQINMQMDKNIQGSLRIK